jgi:nucleoside 2-deoxyribosyltransferase
MGILHRTKTYLAGPMQYKNGEGWRNKIQPLLEKMGIIVFNPYHKPFVKDIEENDNVKKHLDELLKNNRYDEVQKRMKEIRSYDLNLVDRSDFVIAYIDPSTPTFGTIEELVTSVRMKRPTFVSIEGTKKKCPLWLLGMFPHKYIYDSVDDILEMLIKIDEGKKKIDSDRWRLLKPEFR